MRFKEGDRVKHVDFGHVFYGTVLSANSVDSLVYFDNGMAIRMNNHLLQPSPPKRVGIIAQGLPADCPECRGTGFVTLFTSVAACSRGCRS